MTYTLCDITSDKSEKLLNSEIFRKRLNRSKHRRLKNRSSQVMKENTFDGLKSERNFRRGPWHIAIFTTAQEVK